MYVRVCVCMYTCAWVHVCVCTFAYAPDESCWLFLRVVWWGGREERAVGMEVHVNPSVLSQEVVMGQF